MLFVAVRPAHAGTEGQTAPFSVSLEYAVPDGCPTLEVFEEVVSKRLGYEPFSTKAPAHVQVLITRGEVGTKGLLSWRDSAGSTTGEQTFPSRTNDCGELVAAVGFALAVQIQLLAKTQPQGVQALNATSTAQPADKKERSEPPPTDEGQAPRSSSSTPAPAEKLDRGARAPAAFFAGGGAGLAFGASPATAPFFRLFGAVAWPHASLELGAELSLPQSTQRADGAGYSQQNVLGSIAGCGVQDRLSACLVLRAGAVHVAGESVDEPRSASAALVQAGIRAGLAQYFGRRFYLSVRGEGLVNATHYEVRLDQLPIWTLPRFSGVAGLDLGVLLFE